MIERNYYQTQNLNRRRLDDELILNSGDPGRDLEALFPVGFVYVDSDGEIIKSNSILLDIFEISEALEFGTVCVNKPFWYVNLPHGGIKESGIGKDCSRYSLEEYFYIKRISITLD